MWVNIKGCIKGLNSCIYYCLLQQLQMKCTFALILQQQEHQLTLTLPHPHHSPRYFHSFKHLVLLKQHQHTYRNRTAEKIPALPPLATRPPTHTQLEYRHPTRRTIQTYISAHAPSKTKRRQPSPSPWTVQPDALTTSFRNNWHLQTIWRSFMSNHRWVWMGSIHYEMKSIKVWCLCHTLITSINLLHLLFFNPTRLVFYLPQ